MKQIRSDKETTTVEFTWRELQLINNTLCTFAKKGDPPEFEKLVSDFWQLGFEKPEFFKSAGEQIFSQGRGPN